MSLEKLGLLLGAASLVSMVIGYYLRILVAKSKKGSMELDIQQMMLQAKDKEQKIIEEAERKAEDIVTTARTEIKQKEEDAKKNEERLIKKDELLLKRQGDLDAEVEEVKKKIQEIKQIRENADKMEMQKKEELQKIARLTPEEAREEILKRVERESEEDILARMKKLEMYGSEKIEEKAKEILATSIQRLSNSVTSDMLTTSVSIPSDEIKGKIIGKEGRNIKAFERCTGVEVIVDDTPGSITISSFDPVRRQIAKLALEKLITDGRIQPAKIEDMVKLAEEEINKIIRQKGEEAVYETGVLGLDPKVVSILGRLHFRTSYGQNVLAHSVEMTHIAGMLAEEIGANVQVAKAGALVHDIGKALDHEVVGTHVEIGRKILQKFGTDENIIKAMQAHHEEYPYETIESMIVQSADAISGGRPGARRDSIENYLKRLKDLEAVANSFKGVEKSYALQAGREIRIFVTPNEVTDLEAKKMARDIATKIESELKYPGEIKVSVIRESRTIEFAR
ncbi:MAG TPA: ribonuclease Y [Parcubacteria group bacterium]|jgi:ribonuclease Y|nr:ribonuclease Y [Parcubacteria group bacterium]